MTPHTSRAHAFGVAAATLALVVAACSEPTVSATTSTTIQRSTTSTQLPSTTTAPGPTTSTSATPGTTTAGFVPDDRVLLVVGDWGSGTLPQGAVAGAMERYAGTRDVAAILTTGDNFYSDDAEFLMQPYEWLAETGIPMWVTWGNHDVESERRIEVVSEALGSPPRWAVYEWGDVDVIVLDSNQITSLNQAAFFVSAMAASDRPTIVALHHPPYSCSHHGSTTEVVNQWVDILDDDIILVLSGHDHSYQRFENNGVSYVVTGGGGRALRPLTDCPDNHPERQAGAEAFHFVSLEQTADNLIVEAIDVNGDVFDTVAIALP